MIKLLLSALFFSILFVEDATACCSPGQVCEDTDCDGRVNGSDNCTFVYNPDQADDYGIYKWGPDYKGNACQPTLDTDNDGAWDIYDNCIIVSNTDQFDSDNDGYGNACDGDFDNDNVVAVSDFSIFKAAFQTTVGAEEYNPHVDLNQDNVINASDFSIFKNLIFNFSGPSGRNCAGYINCFPLYPYCINCNWWGW